VGLERWTVLLGDEAELAALRGRLDSAGIEHEDVDGGLLVRDPWINAILFRAS
jgi:hypothetical protein